LARARRLLPFVIALACTNIGRGEDQPLPELLATFRREFIAITPGQGEFPAEFKMGRDDGEASERPAHRVGLDDEFAVARYEVPQNLWQAVMGENPSKWKGPRNSVEEVSWDDCQKFCQRLTLHLRDAKLIDADEVVRIPSEAEWEYCTRAGTSTRYSFGDDVERLGDYGWFTGNAAGNDPPVGAKQPNPWQLYDVHGYLSEWCADAWHDDYEGALADGSAWNTGGDTKRAVLRGGSWKDTAEKLTSTARQPADKSLRDDAVGLRCVLAKTATRTGTDSE
jgi:formylglycine-generating enzyme required for sulfatase activity